MVRYQDIKTKAYQILDLTSWTVDEFEQLVLPFEAAFVRQDDRGKPRTRRRYSQYANCPLPTPEDCLLFILSYLKVAALQVAHAAMFGMTQPNANKWIQVLLPVLHQILVDLHDVPARLFHDGTEHSITRPQGDCQREANYSRIWALWALRSLA